MGVADFPPLKQPTVDEPPPASTNSSNNNDHSNGFNIIQWIYGFLIQRNPIAYKYLSIYKKKLDVKYEHPWIYRFFLFLSMTIDTLLAFGVVVIVLALLIIITLVFARGVGIFDWLPEIVKTLKQL